MHCSGRSVTVSWVQSIRKRGVNMHFFRSFFSPLAGFLSGWVSFIVGFTAPVAASSLAFSEYLFRTFPEGTNPGSLLVPKKAVASGIILLFTAIHYAGMKSGARVQNLLTVLKITLVSGLILTGFLFGEGSFSNLSAPVVEAAEKADFKSIGLALMWIMFAFSGWNAVTYVGSEVINPIRNIPRSLIAGTLVVTVLYLFLNLLYMYAVPAEEMKGVISIGGLAANNLFGRSMDHLFSLFIAVILLSAISSLIIIGPRVYFAMAQSGHFFPLAGRVNRFSVPGNSILMQSGLALIFVISGTFDQIITFLSFSLGIFPILAVLGVFKLRIRQQSVFRVRGYPFIQILFIIFSLVILVLAYMERPVESSIALGVIVVGIPVYYLLKRQRERSAAS